jgi:hypothetical protein
VKLKSQKDFWAGLLFLVAGIVFAAGAQHFGMGVSARPGPGFFRLVLGLVLALLGALVLFKALTIEVEGGEPVGLIAWRPLVLVVSSVLFFGTALPRLGLSLSLPVLVIGAGLASDAFRWKEGIAIAAVLTAACCAVFGAWLKLAIPLWPRLG